MPQRPMNKIIKLESYRRDKNAIKNKHKMLRLQGGYRWADLAIKIMQEEMSKRDDIDYAAVSYSFLRFNIKMLQKHGWTNRDIEKIFKDVLAEK